jgi:hypothetical protein
MTIQPIQTRYAGCHFRSRTEARWAVFFSEMGIDWQYEVQGFVIRTRDGTRPYLPDFYLPDTGTWVEVKGSETAFRKDVPVYAHAVADGQLPGLDDPSAGLLCLGPIPEEYDCDYDHGSIPLHLYLKKVGHTTAAHWAAFVPMGVESQLEWRSGVSPPDLPDLGSQGFLEPFEAMSGFLSRGDERSLHAAYRAARSARFEHGQSGAS